MRIVKIEVFHIKVPLRRSYQLSKVIGTLQFTEPIILRAFTDEGIVGIGETDPLVPFTEESPESIKVCLKRYLGPYLIEQKIDPTNILKVHEEMDKLLKQNLLAKAAIDMACYDILGKQVKLPIYKLLGGCVRSEIPISAPAGIGGGSLEDNVKEVLKSVKKGIKTFMVKAGSSTLKEDIARVEAIRKIDEDIHIIVDANQGWDSYTAIKFGKFIEKYNIDFLEQPVPYWDIDGLVKIRKSINIPISVDETLFTINDAISVIQKGAADIFSIKVAKNGGIYKANQIINLAKAFNIKCFMNSMIEEGITQSASLQLGMSSGNLLELGHAYSSPLRLEEDISNYSDQINGDVVIPSQKSGLGIDIKMDVLKKYTIDTFEIEI